MRKLIKKSNRGLTFSFEGKNTNFNIGGKYRYIVEPKSNKVYIVPSNSDKALTISKKRVGKTIKSLIDLRSKAVVNSFNNAELLEVKIQKNTIVVEVYKESATSTVISSLTKGLGLKSNKVVDITKKLNRCRKVEEYRFDLSLIDKVSGDISYSALGSILRTLDSNEWFSSSEEVREVSDGLNATIKVLSVCSGSGMFDLPLFQDKDFKIVKAIELNPSACASYEENIGQVIKNEDIRNFHVDNSSKYDLLWGGPPCTPYSNSNRVNQLEKHKDIDLVGEYIRIVKEANVGAFVMENVPQLITARNGKFINDLKERLQEYDIKHIILQDNQCGGYTTRKRAFIFGSRIGNVVLNYVTRVGKTVGDALKKVTDKWFNFKDITMPGDDTKERMSYVPQGGNWMDIPKELWQPSYKVGKTHSNTYRRLELHKPSITLANYRKCNLIHPTEDRGLSVAEALAISGFDENFKLLGSLPDKQLQTANGVPFYLGLTVKNIIKKVFLKYLYKNNLCIY